MYYELKPDLASYLKKKYPFIIKINFKIYHKNLVKSVRKSSILPVMCQGEAINWTNADIDNWTFRNRLQWNSKCVWKCHLQNISHFVPTSLGWCRYSQVLFYHGYLSHWVQDKMAAIFQTTISNGFSWTKSSYFDVSFTEVCFVPKDPIDNEPSLVQIMAWRRTGDKPLSEPMMALFTDAYVSLCLNELYNKIKLIEIYIALNSQKISAASRGGQFGPFLTKPPPLSLERGSRHPLKIWLFVLDLI